MRNLCINDLNVTRPEIFKKYIKLILNDKLPPDITIFSLVTDAVNELLISEDIDIRPKDEYGISGGLIDLSSYKMTIILPDLHARRSFFQNILDWIPGITPGNESIYELLSKNSLAFLCLGDGIHSEANQMDRWLLAFEEYNNGFAKHENIDREIADSFNLMVAVMLIKIQFPDSFHYLKGNHDNIANETGNGNYAFTKFCNEGEIVYEYFNKFYDHDLLTSYYIFEKNLPLFAIGKNFLASHAEPAFFFNKTRIINALNDSKLIEALTWTDNDFSKKGTVDKIIEHFIPDNFEKAYYFGGHRIIDSNYRIVNKTRYIQIHNPRKNIAVFFDQEKDIDLEKDIHDINK
jgi:hypothetical protein